MSETDRKLDRIAELLEEQIRGGGSGGSGRSLPRDPSGGFDFFKNLKDASEPFKQSLKDFDRALSDSNTSLHTFSKYTYAADNGLAAITRLATGIPYLGKAVEKLGTAFSGLLGAVFKQTDELLQASDQFAKIGAAGSLTTKLIMELGEKAGLTTKDLGILTNATSKIGTGLIGLGGNATEGIKAFAGMANVGKDVRQTFQRMGVSQSELIDQMANYVDIQARSGKSMVSQAQDADKLKKSSLEYSENLLRLSALTGKSADVLQEEQKQQAMELEEMIATRQEDDKINELKNSNRKEEAAALQKEQDSRKAFVRDIEAKYGKAAGVALGKVARTGSYDQSTAGYANIGLDAGKIQSDLKNGMDGTKLANEVGDQLKVGMSSLLKNLGQGAQFNAQELFASMGFTDFKELLGKIGTRIGFSDTTQNATAVTTINDNRLLIGEASKDFAQISRNFVKETEIDLTKTKQGFIALANVFVQGPALVEENIKKAGEKLAEFVKNLTPDSVIKAATAQSNTITGAVSDANKAGAAATGVAATVAGKVGEVVAGRVPVVGTAFTILKKVGKLEVIASLIDMVGGDQIAAWLKGTLSAVKGNIPSAPAAPVASPAASAGSPDTSATRSHGTTEETGKEVEPKDVVAQLHAGEKVLPKEEAEKYIKDKAPVPGVAAPVATTSPAYDQTKMSSLMKNLSAQEFQELASMGLTDFKELLGKVGASPVSAAAPAVAAPAAAAPAVVTPAVAAPAVATPAVVASKPWGKSGDANQDIGPAAVEAKSSTNKTNVGNFTIEDYIPNDRKMNDATYNYIPVATPAEVASANPMGQDPAQRAQATAPAEVAAANPMGQDPAQRAQATAPAVTTPVSAPAEVATARPAISASETLSKVTLESVNPVVVEALKTISSTPDSTTTINNSNSEKMMFEVLSLFTDKCDEMIDKLEEANDIAAKILRESR